jgi:hypothetical protein
LTQAVMAANELEYFSRAMSVKPFSNLMRVVAVSGLTSRLATADDFRNGDVGGFSAGDFASAGVFSAVGGSVGLGSRRRPL